MAYKRYNKEVKVQEWIPRTELGKLVKKGEISDIEQIYEKNMSILEPEIVDSLVPNIADHVLDIKMVQRTTDCGRKGTFMVTVAVGNKEGCVGLGIGKGQAVRQTIEKAIVNAKKNLICIKRGCGSWECGCDEPHSIPFKISGKNSSVKVELKPAPKGTGIVAGKTAKKILELAGVRDVWSQTYGNTRTDFNFGKAVISALKQTRKSKSLKSDRK